MIKSVNITSIEKKFGKSWDYWMKYMSSINAGTLNHAEIAKLVDKKIHDSWWAQNITVAYEQQSGRRKPGQREDGTFEASISKTSTYEPEVLIKKWTKYAEKNKKFNNRLATEPKISNTTKRHLWKVNLKNSNKAFVATEKMKNGKSQISVMEQRIKTEKELEIAKKFWTSVMRDFFESQ